jgi:hypothetical protein
MSDKLEEIFYRIFLTIYLQIEKIGGCLIFLKTLLDPIGSRSMFFKKKAPAPRLAGLCGGGGSF